MQISGARRLIAGTVVLVVLVLGWVAWAGTREDTTTAGVTSAAAGPAVIAPAARSVSVVRAVSSLAVLRDWDRLRAQAWAAGDAGGLRQLYVRGSSAGVDDVRMLRSWTGRGLRVTGMTMQVLRVELRRRTAGRLTLVVTDRLADARAAAGTATEGVALPRDRPTTRRLTFHKVRGAWLLATVVEVAGGRSAPAP